MQNGTFRRGVDYTRSFIGWDYDTIPQPVPATFNELTTQERIVWDDHVDSGVNPRHRDQIRQHINATTHNNRDRLTIEGHYTGLAYTTWVRNSDPRRYIKRQVSGCIPAMFANPALIRVVNLYSNASMKSRVVNRTLVGFLSNCRNAQTTFQGGVFVGEIRETLHQIIRPAKSIRKLITSYYTDAKHRTRKMRSGRRYTPIRITDANKVLSDTWLEYSFGLSPLLQDVREGAQALARLSLDPQEYKRVSFAFDEFEPDSSVSPSGTLNFNTTLWSGIRYNVFCRSKVGYKSKMTGEVRCKIENPLTLNREVLGFDPKSFVPTVWELIPYSFLVDYFTNIGDCINAWTFPLTDISWWSRSTIALCERELAAHMIYTGTSNSAIYHVGDWSGTDFHITLKRSRIERDSTSLGIPTIRFRIPGFSLKWLNIGALAHMRT